MRPRRWFTRSQVVLLLIVANVSLIVVGSLLLARYRRADGMDAQATFDSITQPASRVSSSGYYATPSRQVEAFEFDPNEADSMQLLRLGLAPFQVRSIYRYRAKGGRFSTPDDFRRVYRLTNEQWEHLSPLIRIADRYRLVDVLPSGDDRMARLHRRSVSTDSAPDTLAATRDTTPAKAERARADYPRKLAGDETLDINLADSVSLCRVPGIGPYYARKIVDYRRRLGGYVRVEQLLQIDNFPADAIAWLVVSDTVQIKRLQVNRLSTRQLMKHPYMGYYRASEINNYRRIYGKVTGLDVLKNLPHFTEEDILRLAPYLDFE